MLTLCLLRELGPRVRTRKRMEARSTERSAALRTRKRVGAETSTVTAAVPVKVQATRSGRSRSS
jgi:hypothetical protein